RALRLLPLKRIPPRSSPRGRNAWALRPRKTRGGRNGERAMPTHPTDGHDCARFTVAGCSALRGRGYRVEPALDLAQLRIDRSRKGRAHACFALILGHEIDIGAAGRERPGGAPIFTRPDEMATILLGALPRRLDVQHVGCRSQADRVHARIETRGG